MISALAAVGYGQSETLSSVSGMKLFWSQNRSLWLTVGQPQHIHLVLYRDNSEQYQLLLTRHGGTVYKKNTPSQKMSLQWESVNK